MDKLKGRITISRVTSNQKADYIEIKLRDETSGIQFLEIRLTPGALALALTGLAYQDCEYDLIMANNIGKRCEMKIERVLIPVRYPRYKDIIEAASIHEINDWHCDFSPSSRIISSDWDGSICSVEVSFVRWIEV